MRVSDEYRKNHLSLKPGGSIVSVTFSNGSVREYDKVKFPQSYVGQIEGKENITQILVDSKLVWTNKETKKFWEK